jgi:hypothetical protein
VLSSRMSRMRRSSVRMFIYKKTARGLAVFACLGVDRVQFERNGSASGGAGK